MARARAGPGPANAAHAKGVLLAGTFVPSAEAGQLSRATHFNNPSTPLILRFSSSTGIHAIPDTDPNGNPRGLAVRFVLGDHKHTDIIAHSTPFFPMRTGEGFYKLLGALGDGTIGQFLEENPSAKAFVTAPKPFPAGLETQTYYGVNAFKLVSKDGRVTYVRYRILPEKEELLSEDEAQKKDSEYLFRSLADKLSKGSPITMNLVAQVAEEGDQTDDATVHWPESRKIVKLGTITIEKELDADVQGKEQKYIIFDPIPRVDGIEPSDDPLLDMRAAVYLISGKGRRQA